MLKLGKTCGISNAVTYRDFIKNCPLSLLCLKLEFELTVKKVKVKIPGAFRTNF